MVLLNNESYANDIEKQLDFIKKCATQKIFLDPFMKDFALRFCWSSNAIEGNTLSLSETIALIDYDEVKAGHTYTEYEEAKNLYHAITKFLMPLQKKEITKEWIISANGMILGMQKNHGFRETDVYIGSLAEAVYYPPAPEQVPDLMEEFIKKCDSKKMENNSLMDVINEIAKHHIMFERIHPFIDGNGRVGRMILNQELINAGLLPVAIDSVGKYRQAFRRYENHGDYSLLVAQICKAELSSIEKLKILCQKKNQQKETKDLILKI